MKLFRTNFFYIPLLGFALLLSAAISNADANANANANDITDTSVPLVTRLDALAELYALDRAGAANLFHQSNLPFLLSKQSNSFGSLPPSSTNSNDEFVSDSINAILKDLLDPLSEIEREIEGDVLDFNNVALERGTKGAFPALNLAGSSSSHKRLYSTEARVHYRALIQDISPRSYLHHAVVPNGFVDHFVPMIQEKFQFQGFDLFTLIVGNGSHFVSLALDTRGSIAVIDSSPFALMYSQAVSHRKLKSLMIGLNQYNILRPDGSRIQFNTPRYIRTTQQHDRCNCLIFSILNTHQMAKRASIEGYLEVSHALESGLLRSYEDMFRIGEFPAETSFNFLKTLFRPSYWSAYSAFMKDFRKTTQSLLEEYLEKRL